MRGIALALAAVIAAPAFAQSPTPEEGRDYLLSGCHAAVARRDRDVPLTDQQLWASMYCTGLVHGAIEQLTLMQVTGVVGLRTCLPTSPQLGTEQGQRILLAFLDRHPEARRLPVSVSLHEALAAAYPCPRKRY